MLLAKCPKCHEPVTLPGLIDVETQVRCPLCAEVYAFRDVLDRLPPVLEIVSTPVSTHAAGAASALAGQALDDDSYVTQESSVESQTAFATESDIHDEPVLTSASAVDQEPDLHGGVEERSVADTLPRTTNEDPWSDASPVPIDGPADNASSWIDADAPTMVDDELGMLDEEIVMESADQPELAEEELAHQEYSPQESFEQVVSPAFSPAVETSLGELLGAGPSSRRRRRRSNPVVEFIKVVLGGLLAIPAAQLILWWLPMNLQPAQRDPMSIGPTVARYIPFVVPESVRNSRTIAQTSPTANSANSSKSRPDRSASATPFGELPDVPGPDGTSAAGEGSMTADGELSTLSGPLTSGESPDADLLTGEPRGARPETSATEEAAFPLDPADALRPTLPAAATRLSSEPYRAATGSVGDDSVSPDSTNSGDSTNPSVVPDPTTANKPATVPGLAAPDSDPVIVQAREINERWESAAAPSRDDHRELYKSLSRLAASATPVKPDEDPSLQAAATEFLGSMSTSDLKRKLIAAAAASWLGNAARDSDGIAFIGSVKDVQEKGTWTEATVELASPDRRVVKVLVPKTRTTELATGRQLLGLGRIVPQPASTLPGYQGTAELAVVLGASRDISMP